MADESTALDVTIISKAWYENWMSFQCEYMGRAGRDVSSLSVCSCTFQGHPQKALADYAPSILYHE